MNDKRALPPPLFMLVALSAVQPMTLNILMPSTPHLARDLGTSYATVQLTLSLYLVTVAIVQLITGPLSDKHGRRPVILWALALFVAGSFAAIFSQSIEMLLAARVVQAIGAGTAFTLTRTIIRDTSEQDEAASRIGYVMVSMLIIPMVTPSLGGFIDTHFNWQSIFIVLTAVGLLVLPMTWRWLPETNPGGAAALKGRSMMAEVPGLLRSRRFVGYVLAICMPGGMFFAFLAGAPHVVVDVMGARSQELGYWFACLAGGYMLGNLGSGRFARRMGADRLIVIGSVLALIGSGLQVALSYVSPWTPALLYLPTMLVSAGNGLTIPCGMAAALSVRPDAAGAASGVAGAAQLGFGAFLSFAMGSAVESWPRSLVVIMFACAVVGMLAQLLLRSGRDS
ncbi:MAG: multidrug effflux MFS transporter [Beijerinckiaceae bacterium]